MVIQLEGHGLERPLSDNGFVNLVPYLKQVGPPRTLLLSPLSFPFLKLNMTRLWFIRAYTFVALPGILNTASAQI